MGFSWFGQRGKTPEVMDDRHEEGEDYGLEPLPLVEDRPYARTTVAFAPKPDDLVRQARAVTDGAWLSPPLSVNPVILPAPAAPKPEVRRSSLTAPWLDGPPSMTGLYWYSIPGKPEVMPRLCIVAEFGGKLSLSERHAGSVKYTLVAGLNRLWAGPIATPVGVAFDDLDLS